MTEDSKETRTTQETSGSEQERNASVVELLLIARIRSLAQQSKVGVIGGFVVALALGFGGLLLTLSLTDLSPNIKFGVAIIILLPAIIGAKQFLNKAGVV